jgi:hypothetical protein
MGKNRKLGALYFTDVARVDKDTVILTGNYYALEDSEEERTALLSLKKGNWGGLDLSGIAHAVRFIGTSRQKKEYLVLERNRGLYRIVPPKSVKFEMINKNREGFLMDLRRIANNWYAVGGHHQIYREDNGRWIQIDDGVYVTSEEGEAKILLSVDGNSEKDIYTVGFNGVIFHYDGTSWRLLDSPTNMGFQRVLCINEEEIYICGYGNSLYRGNKNGWQALTEPDDSITYWDMAYFKGRVYVCTKKKLFEIQNDQLEEVEIPVKGPLGFYRMDSDENELWTCGNECLLKFDGETWTQYIFPDNI